jgi:cytochrome c oxidase subunit 1
MTATQAPPAAAAPDAPASAAPAPTGLAGILGSSDHKVVGRLYIGAALLFGLATVTTGVLAGVDRIDGRLGNTILETDTVGQVFAFASSSATLLVALPALIGLAMVVVPLQVGARSIAFPRAAAASFWGYLMGASLTVTAYAINGGPGGGRTDAVDMWVAATVLVIVSLLLGSVCIATTVLAVRGEGMTLSRVPMFSWSMLCAATIWILTLPVAVAALAILFVDHRYGQVFTGATGPDMAAQVAWIGRQPQVYALAIPILGIALDAASTAGGARVAKRGAAQVLIGIFAVLSIGAFHLPALIATTEPVTKGMALLAPLPVLGLLGLVALTLKEGTPTPTSGMVGSVLALLVLLTATIVGALVPFQSLLELQGTLWETAQAHLVLGAVAVGFVAGLYHWAAKVVGRAGLESMGRLAPLPLALGALVIAVPEAISGVSGEGDEAFTGIEALNTVSVTGVGIFVLGGLIAVAGLVGRRRDDEPADPWDGGQTLEWATASPPSFGNFDGPVPPVTSAEPLRPADADEVIA